MNYCADEDGPSVEAFCNGDRHAFEPLMSRYGTPVYSYLCHMLQDEATASGLFQLAFIRAFKRLESCRNGSSFRKHIFTMAHHLVADYLLRHPEAEPPVTSGGTCTSAVDSSAAAAQQGDMPDGKQAGNPPHRGRHSLTTLELEVILLREYSGLRFKDIAEITDTPVNTVLSRMRCGVTKLHRSMTEQI